MASQIASTILDPMIKHGIDALAADARHRREHPTPLPTNSTDNNRGNTYGLVATNNSSTTRTDVRVFDKKEKKNGLTLFETISRLFLFAILKSLIDTFAAPAFEAAKAAVESYRGLDTEDKAAAADKAAERTRHAEPPTRQPCNCHNHNPAPSPPSNEETTEFNIQILASQYPSLEQSFITDILVNSGNSVETASTFFHSHLF